MVTERLQQVQQKLPEGVEGRIFTPMGVAYLVSIFASTFVAMTLSPALCAILLANRSLPTDDT